MSEANTNQREKRHAALYFSPANSTAYKELAARIRNDGGRTTLVWSKQWKGPESIRTEVRAIVVEAGCANADKIVEAYQRYAIDVEVHFADASGEFIAEDEPEDTGGATNEEEHVDTDAETDAVVEVEEPATEDDGENLDSLVEDAGTQDDSGEEGAEESTDTVEPTRD